MPLNNFLAGLPEPPAFRNFWFDDRNNLAKTKKKRKISAPNKGMRILHARMICALRRAVPIDLLAAATGCRQRNSPRRNVEIHRRHRYFFATDIHSAYPSVNGERLADILRQILGENFVVSVESFLADYFLDENGGLRIGGPASPDLFNLYAAVVLDQPLRELCQKYELTYTRYLDDLVFSADQPIGVRKRQAIRQLIAAADFQVSHRKSQVVDLEKQPIEINGVGLASGGRIFLPRHFLRKIRGLLYRALIQSDVPPSLVHGYMGVFWSVTGRDSSFNKTEQGVIRLYQEYRRLIASGWIQ